MLKLFFWKNKQSGNFFSHRNGLTKEQVDLLKELKPGDRLVLWLNDKESNSNYPELTLKVFSTDNTNAEK